LITKIINCLLYSIYIHCCLSCDVLIWLIGMSILYIFCFLWCDTLNCSLGNIVFYVLLLCIVFLWLVLHVLCSCDLYCVLLLCFDLFHIQRLGCLIWISEHEINEWMNEERTEVLKEKHVPEQLGPLQTQIDHPGIKPGLSWWLVINHLGHGKAHFSVLHM
jgi:hypothetical protein